MRFFDVTEARQLVPFMRTTFERVHACLEEARRDAERLGEESVPAAERERLQHTLHELAVQVRQELERLEALGIEVKAVEGLVDFRAHLGGRQVYLCWCYPEDTVSHWHELDEGFTGRQLIEGSGGFAPSYPC
jgi:hypothetical protein